MSKLSIYSPVLPVFLLGAAVPCLAQENSDAQNSGIPEIIVTATKREQSLREIPASIAALTGNQLEKQAITSQEALVRLVPGVVLQVQPADTNRIIVRGVSPAPKGAPNQTTQVMFGDVPFVDNYAPRFVPDPLPFDIRTVEILKGPQGTLFGSGSLNGTVRYIYNQPEYGVFSAQYMGEYTAIHEGDGDFLVAGTVNVPLGENVALRATGYTGRNPGYNDNTTPGHEEKDINWRDRDAIRVSLGLSPSDAWDVRLSYSYEKSLRNGSSVSNNLNGDYTNSNLQLNGFYKYDYSVGELNIRRGFDAFDLIAVTGLVRSHSSKDEDLTASILGDTPPSATGGFINVGKDRGIRTNVLTQEVRLVSNDTKSPWKWVVGANYSREKARGIATLENFSDTGVLPAVIPPPFNFYFLFNEPFIRLNWDIKIEELAAFADISRQFFDNKLEVSVGGRYYRFKTKGTSLNQGNLIELTNFAPPGSGLQILNQADRVEDGFNPKASITWRPVRSIMAYAAVSRGFRLGGVQSGWSGFGATEPPPQYVESDWLWNYEAGLRTSWWDNRLHLDVSAYHLDWKNAQFTHSDPTRGAFFTDNIGAVKGDGIEGAIQIEPVRGLSLGASTAYSDIKTAVDFTSVGITVPRGTQWPGSFKWQHAVSVNYSTEVNGLGFDGGASYTSLSGGVADSLFKTGSNHIGYKILDAHLGVRFLRSKWLPDVSLSVRNLFNNHGLAANLTDGSLAGVPYNFVTYVQPRTFVLRLTKSY